MALSGGNGVLADKARAFLVHEGWAGYLGSSTRSPPWQCSSEPELWSPGPSARAHRPHLPVVVRPPGVSRDDRRRQVRSAHRIDHLLAVVVSLVTVVLGLVGGVGPLTADVIGPEVLRLQGVSTTAGLLALTMGFVASLGRGYLPAIGVLAVIIAITQVAVLFGTGGWFPFAVPGLMAVAGVEGISEPTALQVSLVPTVAALGVWLTIRWWQHAEVVSCFSRS